MNEVYIVSAKRTAVGGLLGSLSHLSATQLGAIAIKEAYESVGIDPKNIDSVYMGNVLSANLGQLPARQASIFASIPDKTDATTINKVCASGMKATSIGAQQIQLGLENLIVTGGMESMSNAPHYANIRRGIKAGDLNLVDGMIKDGLWDVYNDFHMGSAAELGVKKYKLSREALDAYAISSYQKAQEATKNNKFKNEIAPITVEQKNGSFVIDRDEDIDKIILDKVSKLKPVFEKDGNLTAANSSNLNDGAAAFSISFKRSS